MVRVGHGLGGVEQSGVWVVGVGRGWWVSGVGCGIVCGMWRGGGGGGCAGSVWVWCELGMVGPRGAGLE